MTRYGRDRIGTESWHISCGGLILMSRCRVCPRVPIREMSLCLAVATVPMVLRLSCRHICALACVLILAWFWCCRKVIALLRTLVYVGVCLLSTCDRLSNVR